MNDQTAAFDWPPVESLPPWGTREALCWGIAHPDWPWHTAETRAEYEYPTGRWWFFQGRREAA